MKVPAISYDHLPRLNRPLLIAAFAGWGNALSVSTDMTAYLISGLKAEKFADINPDNFYRYDETRPQVSIVKGLLAEFSLPGGSFYAAHTGTNYRDIVIFKGDEPNLSWNLFIEELLLLSRKLKVDTIITLGSMFDQVLHTDMIISGIASSKALSSRLAGYDISPISYQGPSAIHSIVQVEGRKQGFDCMSLWSHCPFYIQCSQHFGYLARLGTLLSSLGEFDLDTTRLNRDWKKLEKQIAYLITGNPELQNMIKKMRKPDSPTPGPGPGLGNEHEKKEKIIDLRDFMPSRKKEGDE